MLSALTRPEQDALPEDDGAAANPMGMGAGGGAGGFDMASMSAYSVHFAVLTLAVAGMGQGVAGMGSGAGGMDFEKERGKEEGETS